METAIWSHSSTGRLLQPSWTTSVPQANFSSSQTYFEASSRKFKTAGLGEKNKKSFVQHVQFESCQEILLLPFHYTLLWRNHFSFYKVRRTLKSGGCPQLSLMDRWPAQTHNKGSVVMLPVPFHEIFFGINWRKHFVQLKIFFPASCLCQGQCFYYVGEVYTPSGGWFNTFSFTKRPTDLSS